mmetsp:Transcript_13347/g.43620  ORF Transcript_13347/g.43620 Transcript_13347/m.43620 type:complete len:247 (-) Transcript_13347:959-1699(-)
MAASRLARKCSRERFTGVTKLELGRVAPHRLAVDAPLPRARPVARDPRQGRRLDETVHRCQGHRRDKPRTLPLISQDERGLGRGAQDDGAVVGAAGRLLPQPERRRHTPVGLTCVCQHKCFPRCQPLQPGNGRTCHRQPHGPRPLVGGSGEQTAQHGVVHGPEQPVQLAERVHARPLEGEGLKRLVIFDICTAGGGVPRAGNVGPNTLAAEGDRAEAHPVVPPGGGLGRPLASQLLPPQPPGDHPA